MIWFTADTHFNHYNILDFSARPFKDLKEHDETLIQNWNSLVKTGDTAYILGDFCFGKAEDIRHYRSRLKGKIHLICGGHDYKNKIKQVSHIFSSVNDLLTIKHNHQPIVLCHYQMTVWDKSHYGSWQLYGHCIDTDTEILTNNGWKTYQTIKITDKALTLNIEKKHLEYKKIKNIYHYPNYCGDVYNFTHCKGGNLRVTGDHVMIDYKPWINKYRTFLAKDTANIDSRLFPKSGYLKQNGISLSDNMLKLLVWIAADGSIYNTDLIRIRIFKERKQIRIKELLNILNIDYREKPQKDGSISFNFTLPRELQKWSLKPIDKRIEKCSEHQLNILLEEYSHTDGYKIGNCIVIFTSKKSEANSIQIACIKNKFTANIYTRLKHGFSKKPNYQITISKQMFRDHSNLKKSIIKENVTNEYFWCINTDNKTIITRKNGTHWITGNSHGMSKPVGKQMDVGIDGNEYKPYSIDEIFELMKYKDCNINYLGDKWKVIDILTNKVIFFDTEFALEMYLKTKDKQYFKIEKIKGTKRD